MKRFLLLFCVACVALAACGDDRDEPVEIVIDEDVAGVSAVYLYRYGMEWRDVPNNSLVVIRTVEELKSHVDGPCEGLASDIDFASRSLIVCKLYTNQLIYSAGWSYILTTGNPVFSVDVLLTAAQEPETRYVAILVPRLPAEAEVALRLKIS